MITSLPRTALALGLVTSLAACGGKSSSTTTPPPGGEEEAKVAGNETPFDDEAVQQILATLPTPEPCGGPEAGATLADLFAAQQASLGDGTEVSFSCHPNEGEPWECTWSVLTVSSGAADPEDPCAGEGGSGYQIMVRVDDAGAIVPDSVYCVAPG